MASKLKTIEQVKDEARREKASKDNATALAILAMSQGARSPFEFLNMNFPGEMKMVDPRVLKAMVPHHVNMGMQGFVNAQKEGFFQPFTREQLADNITGALPRMPAVPLPALANPAVLLGLSAILGSQLPEMRKQAGEAMEKIQFNRDLKRFPWGTMFDLDATERGIKKLLKEK